MTIEFANLRNITRYDSAYELIRCETEYLDNCTAEFIENLKCVDDYESYAYYVLNYKTVAIADSISGYVMSTEPLEMFWQETKFHIDNG